jgi:hypothetical protein
MVRPKKYQTDEERKEAQRAANKKHYDNHQQYFSDKNHKYYLENRDEMLERFHDNYLTRKEERKGITDNK